MANIKHMYATGVITRDEAKILSKPVLDRINEATKVKTKELNKKYGLHRKPVLLDFINAMRNKSAKAALVIDTAQEFFSRYLFVTKSNYDEYVKRSQNTLKRKTAEFDSSIARLKVEISNRDKSYEQTKKLLLDNPELKAHYNLDKSAKELEGLNNTYKDLLRQRESIKESIPEFEEYLKLFESIPVILGKIRDMRVMDALLRIFFSNFTITPTETTSVRGQRLLIN